MKMNQLLKRYNALTAGMLVLVSPFAFSFNLSNTLFEKAGTKYGLDPLLIYSVALAESASGRGKGYISPWAWTLRSPSVAFYANDQEKAEHKLSEFISTYGDSIDVGYMQINIKWHGSRVNNYNDLLDPETNIFLGSEILKTAISSAPGDPSLGIGRYHHWADENRSREYGNRVLRIYEGLKQL